MDSKSLCIIFLLAAVSVNPVLGYVKSEENTIKDVGASKVFFVHIPVSGNYRDHIYVIGLSDNTHVSIYDITNPDAPTLVKEGTVDNGKNLLFEATSKKYYKIIADRSVVAWAVGGSGANWEDDNYDGVGDAIFYPSVNGSYVGRDFTFMASGAYYYTTGTGNSWLGTDVYTQIPSSNFETKVYSVQAADITVYNASGAPLYQFFMGPDMCRNFPSLAWETYHVVSTGDIILQCAGGGATFTVAPSTDGNLVGKVHYGSTFAWQRGCFLCISYEPGHVNVYDVDTGALLYEHTFTMAGEYWYRGGMGMVVVRPGFDINVALENAKHVNNVGSKNLKFESTGDIVVYVGDTAGSNIWDDSPSAIGDNIGFAGGIDAKEFYVYAPSHLVVFAPWDVYLEVNGTSQDLKENYYLNLAKEGLYHIVSDKPVIVQVVGLSGGPTNNPPRGVSYAEYLVSFPDISATVPETGGTGSGFDITTIVIGAAIAGVAAVALLMIMRSKKKTVPNTSQ